MRYLVIPLLVVALAAASTSYASTVQTPSKFSKITKHDQEVLRFFQHHPKLARTAAGGRALAKLLPRVVGELRTLEASKPPAHELLWKCIAGYPGFRPGGGSGESGGSNNARNGRYTGILQMHPDWGYGIVGDASAYTAAEVMAAAEKGYAASGYSSGFLVGQWGATIGPCWRYA